MKKNRMRALLRLSRVVCAVLAVMGTYCLGSALAVPAEVRMDVLLWPSGGRIEVVEELPVRDGSVTFVLPAGAQLGSLHLSVDGGTVVQQEAEPVDSFNPALATLRTSLQEARTQAAAVEGELATAKARMSLWSAGTAKNKSVEEMQKLDAEMGVHLSELYVQVAALQPRRTEILRRVQLLEQELKNKGDRLEATRITAQVLLPDMKDVSGEKTATVRYSCTLTGCGWSPVYRLDAFPDKELVRFTQEAEIMQSTGQDWNGVTLTLASGEPGDALMPAQLRDWRLQAFQRPQQRSVQMMEAKPMMANRDMPMASAVIAMKEQSTFTSMDLGTQNVRAGVPVRLGLDSGDWKATFVRVARPSTHRTPRTTGENARQATWLMTKVTLPEAQDYPSGMAQFSVDGRPVGTELFSFVGDQKTLFFGKDARVTAEMKLDARQSGSKGFVDKQQTRIWSWNIAVRNSHGTPVLVRVEDPEPQSGDKAIELKVTSTPKPVVEDHTYIWNLTVPAGGTSTIAHTVEASAPKDMQLDEGR